MLTLALDTTAEYGSLALCEDGGPREEVLLHAPDGFSTVIFAAIEALLERQRVRLTDIDLFAGAGGPGSFTGVRVGLAAMKGLGETLGRPVVAVSNLKALATFGSTKLRAVVIDARRGEVFAALYDGAGNAVMEERVLPFAHFVQLLKSREFEWICADFSPFQTAAEETLPSFPVVKAPLALASAIASIASRELPIDSALVEANYVRRSDAELLWKG